MVARSLLLDCSLSLLLQRGKRVYSVAVRVLPQPANRLTAAAEEEDEDATRRRRENNVSDCECRRRAREKDQNRQYAINDEMK
jgi:hypothetical protein